MNKRHTIILSSAGFFLGTLFFALYQEWIIIRYPWRTKLHQQHLHTKKTAPLTFWHNGAWHTETQELIWSESVAHNVQYLVTSWLTLLQEEEVTDKKITLQSAALSPSGQEAYLSFDRNLLPKECSSYEKWMRIEGLLRTMRENDIQLQGVHILVHHQPLQDPHLDFSNPWPLTGFLVSNTAT